MYATSSTSSRGGAGGSSNTVAPLISAEAHLNASATLAVQRVGIALRRLASGNNINSVGQDATKVRGRAVLLPLPTVNHLIC